MSAGTVNAGAARRGPRPVRDLVVAALALFVALVLARGYAAVAHPLTPVVVLGPGVQLVPGASAHYFTGYADSGQSGQWPSWPSWLEQLLSYLVTWVPLAVAVLWCARSRLRAWLRFRWSDLYFGMLVGVLARCVALFVSTVAFGDVGSGSVGVGAGASPFVFGVIAPVLVAPLVEETFFRGLLLSALRSCGLGRWSSAALGAAVFALVHVLVLAGPVTAASLLVTFVPLFALGLANGWLVTRHPEGGGSADAGADAAAPRLGAALIAHAAFNALGVL